MPAISGGDNVIIQGRPIGRRWTLYVYQPATLWTGTVGGSPSRGDRSLTVATVTGALADIYSDMTIRVTDSADAIKDYPSKVRFRDDPDATTITIGDNNIDWTAGDKLTAQRLFEIWPRHVYIDSDGVQFKDRDIAWSSDAEVQRPKANGGPAAIGTLSGGVCDLVFTDAGSFVTPTGGAITSQAWAAMGGTPAVQAGAENSGTVTYRYSSAGYYYVRHTVQDANAKTGFVYIPVIVDDGTYGITGAVPGDREWDKSVKGWKLSRDLLGLDTDETKFYDGAPVFLAADDNQVADSAFPANRSSLRWSGWLIEDDVSRAKRSRTISYRAVSTNHILQTIPAYPIRIGVLASPADWYNIKTANTDAISLYLMFWHSTVHHICDYHPTGEYASRLRAGERCRSENLLSQLNWVLAGPVADLRCDRQGVLRAIRSEWHLSAAEQAAITTVFSMALEDVQSIEYGPRPHRATVREVKAGGVDGSSNPYLSGAPGAAPLDGGRPEEFMSLAPNSQAELNQWCAQELSVRNWSIPVTIKLAGEYDVVDPALGEFVWFNAGTLFGEPKLPNGDFSIDGVRFTDDHQNGYTFAEWELIPDPSAYGAYGSDTRDIPIEPPPPPPPPIEENDYEDPEPSVLWPANVYFCAVGAAAGANSGGVWHTSTFTAHDESTQPTWTKCSTAGTWPAANIIRSFGISLADPDEYVYAQTGIGQATGGDIIRYSTTSGAWTTILSDAAVVAAYGANAYLTDMMVDRVTGYLYTIAVAGSNPNVYHVLYRCTNPDAGVPGWSTIVSSTHWLRGNGNIWSYNDQTTYVFTADNPSYEHYMDTSVGGGAWGARDRLTGSVPNVHVRHQSYSNDVYHTWGTTDNMGYFQIGGGAGSAVAVCSVASPSTCWYHESNPAVLMPNLGSPSTFRFVGTDGTKEGRLLTTADKFQTYTDQGYLDIGVNPGPVTRIVSVMADVVNTGDYDMILYGSNDAAGGNEHTIFAAYGSTDITPVGKSGANPDTGVDSIHYQAGGPCWRGIQAYDV